ncbi:hypothetical protein BY996DRAFT_8521226, partial [Phakopsora pachyrhizi]
MMPDIDEVFKSIEAFEMKTEWLTSSKLGKVLKQVGTLDNSKVPLDEKYNIRARAQALEEKWENKENTQPAQVSAENSTKTETSLPEVEAQDEAAPPEMEPQAPNSLNAPAEPQETKDGEMPTKRDEKKDDNTEARIKRRSDKDVIKEDGKKMDCSDSPQTETTKAG